VSTTARELTVLEPAPLTRSREWHAAARRARLLSWLSLAWMGAGLEIDSLELIGYETEAQKFPSTVFSNLSPIPLPYRWEVDGDSVTITVSNGRLDAAFTASWREDGTFSGGWRPNPGADETVNVPYDVGGHRLA
jgi:hypothetical protein